MGRFASGRHAYGISDRSGFRYKLLDMKKEWSGLLVGKDEFESKHPQLEPKYHPADPQSLQYAKPQVIGATVLLGINLVANNIFQSEGMQPVDNNKNTKINSFVGKVEIAIT